MVVLAPPFFDPVACVTLKGYAAPIWADCVSDNTEKFVKALCDLPGKASKGPAGPFEDSHAGVTYRIQGQGPALVLFPLLLSAAQWSAALPALTDHFTIILLAARISAASQCWKTVPEVRAMWEWFAPSFIFSRRNRAKPFSMSEPVRGPSRGLRRKASDHRTRSWASISTPTCCARLGILRDRRGWPTACALKLATPRSCRLRKTASITPTVCAGGMRRRRRAQRNAACREARRPGRRDCARDRHSSSVAS